MTFLANYPNPVSGDMYALAASAAQVGLLSLSTPSEAKIVYTRINVSIPVGSSYNLDMANNGVNNFAIYNSSGIAHGVQWGKVAIFGQTPNEVVNSGLCAAPLQAGKAIGAGAHFGTFLFIQSNYEGTTGGSSSACPWPKQKVAYLGLKFAISNEVHYGWARFTITPSGRAFNAFLTGYAYETVPNKRILAGDIIGPSRLPAKTVPSRTNDGNDKRVRIASRQSSPEIPASLGLLALGADGLAAWRRRGVCRISTITKLQIRSQTGGIYVALPLCVLTDRMCVFDGFFAAHHSVKGDGAAGSQLSRCVSG